MRQLKDYIHVYDNVVSKDVCEKIIEEFEARKEAHEVHDNDLYKFHQLNLNQHMPDLAQAYVGSLMPVYEEYFKSLNSTAYVSLNKWEDIRIKKYVRGSDDKFGTHIDAADASTASRFAVAILYLNTNDGATVFPHQGLGVKPETGRVVIFPPNWMFPHEGRPSSDNDKYIMMTCLHLG